MRRARLEALIATAALDALIPLALLGVAAPGAQYMIVVLSHASSDVFAKQWHDARPGTAITYRLSEPLAPGGARTRRP